QNFRWWSEVVPNLLQGLIGLRDRRKGGQAVGDQVTEQVCQGFAATLCLCYEHLVVAFRNPDWIGHRLHVYNLTTTSCLRKNFSRLVRSTSYSENEDFKPELRGFA